MRTGKRDITPKMAEEISLYYRGMWVEGASENTTGGRRILKAAVGRQDYQVVFHPYDPYTGQHGQDEVKYEGSDFGQAIEVYNGL